MFVIDVCNKFHMPSSGSLVAAIKQIKKKILKMAIMLLFYSLQKVNI
jgi:hypothetical protein